MCDHFIELGEQENGGATEIKLRNKQRAHLFD